MKNGLLIYPHNSQGIFNIGDYVQSIAARQFLPKVDTFLNREHLNEYESDDIRLILNGWFMHTPANWPPANAIKPLFVAFHLNKSAESEMLTSNGIKYLKQHEPIGCRDRYTESLLQSKGIDAYFSGCLTLTLGQTYHHKDIDNAPIYFTDLDSTLKHTFRFQLSCLWSIISKYPLLKKIQNRMKECGLKKKLKSVTAFYTTFKKVISDELFAEAVYRAHEIPDTFENDDEKFKFADKLLQEYSTARFVVSSRIHCALPCLGMGTPVVFVTNELVGDIHNCRLDGLQQLFHTIEISESGISSHIPSIEQLKTTSMFSNKSDYKKYATDLISKCTRFIMA